MDYDCKKADEMDLAVLFLISFEDHGITRAWKGMAWEASNRLYEKGYMLDPEEQE